MENQNYKLTGRNETPDELDAALDAALTHYAAVEPRAGLEERILANLDAEQDGVRQRGWWRWGIPAAVAAAVAVVAIVVTVKTAKPSHPSIANRPVISAPRSSQPQPEVANRNAGQGRGPVHRKTPASLAPTAQPAIAAVANPKLDVFPSPQPLSEEEKILASYVETYPEHAALMARALIGAIRPDQLKAVTAFPSGDETADSQDQKDDTRER